MRYPNINALSRSIGFHEEFRNQIQKYRVNTPLFGGSNGWKTIGDFRCKEFPSRTVGQWK
jgi:hypothetical protein